MKPFMNEDQVENLVKISQSCSENAFLNDLIELFSSETLKRISEIKNAVNKKDFVQLSKAARALKACSCYMGAKKLATISKELEADASEGHIPRNIETIINELEYYYCQSSDYLDTRKVA